MSIVIEVVEKTVKNKSGKSKGGKDYSINLQDAYAHLSTSKFPVKIEVNIEDFNNPYPIGKYSIDPDSFYVGDFDQLSLRYLKLIPQAK